MLLEYNLHHSTKTPWIAHKYTVWKVAIFKKVWWSSFQLRAYDNKANCSYVRKYLAHIYKTLQKR
jgi:hypothetical protein